MKPVQFKKRLIQAVQKTDREVSWAGMGIVDTSDRGYNFKGEDYGTNPIGIAIIYWEIPPIPHFGAVYALAKTWGMHVEHILEFQIGMRHPKAEAVSEWMLEGQNLRREFGQRKKRSKS